jgi:chromosome segregation ATPase
MKEQLAAMKQRVKGLQNDLAEERNQVNELKKYDSVKMKKNLDDNKKRLAEKTSAAEVLQKSLGKTKAENAELLKKVAELEARVAELAPAVEDVELAADSEAA